MQFSEKQKKLLQILADGLFHSGPDLAEQLEVGRTAIWKQINTLEDLGINVIAVSGKGYRLARPIELLDKPLLLKSLNAESQNLITDLQLHDQIDSTNSHLSALTYANPEKTGVVCLAEQQTAGRGRRGRQWVSPFGSNIYCSILWRFTAGPASLSGLSLAVGVAVVEALNIHGIQDVGLKWPNDIYWQQRKLGGILVEVSGETDGPCSAVIGLGLNLFVGSADAAGIEQEWVDIQQIQKYYQQQTGSSEPVVSRQQLVVTLLEQLLAITNNYTQQSFAQYCHAWRQYDCMQGQQVSLFMGDNKIDGTVLGINDAGLLLLRTEAGKVQSFASGEVSFRRA
ncbi:MAG: BirA family transcriptional regulator, biotin operon repressor/biotin---[acetyl-CoA-carboxylase] ligase [Methyloprofundus sp.]|nr:MAG: BirA family transcriptional regulator, biotin operon repressor/biotin---[acetyl-CoA-carboxylase] ligase [Methyloprofundus sp.]